MGFWVYTLCDTCVFPHLRPKYCLHRHGYLIWVAWILKWLGRNEWVGYMRKVEEMWPIRAMGGIVFTGCSIVLCMVIVQVQCIIITYNNYCTFVDRVLYLKGVTSRYLR
jgi:hypothetical protein